MVFSFQHVGNQTISDNLYINIFNDADTFFDKFVLTNSILCTEREDL
jgi:hypothetical protein